MRSSPNGSRSCGTRAHQQAAALAARAAAHTALDNPALTVGL